MESEMIQDAVIRSFEVIGEAIKQLDPALTSQANEVILRPVGETGQLIVVGRPLKFARPLDQSDLQLRALYAIPPETPWLVVFGHARPVGSSVPGSPAIRVGLPSAGETAADSRPDQPSLELVQLFCP